jgi:SAM-dependent methyltransferase
MTEDAEPWDLPAVWRAALVSATRVLDMGTGGGEFLSRFADVLPEHTVATEGWPLNVRIAHDRLAAYGVGVVGAGNEPDDSLRARLPFADASFDLVLNRHESFAPAEVFRVLSPGGAFLTQQVGGDEFGEIRKAFAMSPNAPHVSYERFRGGLADAGFDVVDGGETSGSYEFADVAALVAYVQLVPWDVPDDFTVERYAEALLALHASGPAAGEPLRATRKRFWLKAIKPTGR